MGGAVKPWHHLWNWLTSPWQRARRAEAQLAHAEAAEITLRLVIDEVEVATYTFRGFRLDSTGDWIAPQHTAYGTATFTIETSVEVSVLPVPDDPDAIYFKAVP